MLGLPRRRALSRARIDYYYKPVVLTKGLENSVIYAWVEIARTLTNVEDELCN